MAFLALRFFECPVLRSPPTGEDYAQSYIAALVRSQ